MLIRQAKLHQQLLSPAYALFCSHRHIAWQKKTFETAYNASHSLVAVDKKNKQLCAYLLARSNLDELEIDDIAVLPHMRQQGLAARLIAALISQAEIDNPDHLIRRILLEVDVKNMAAIKLYQKHKFQQIGTRKNYYKLANGHFSDAMVLALEI